MKQYYDSIAQSLIWVIWICPWSELCLNKKNIIKANVIHLGVSYETTIDCVAVCCNLIPGLCVMKTHSLSMFHAGQIIPTSKADNPKSVTLCWRHVLGIIPRCCLRWSLVYLNFKRQSSFTLTRLPYGNQTTPWRSLLVLLSPCHIYIYNGSHCNSIYNGSHCNSSENSSAVHFI